MNLPYKIIVYILLIIFYSCSQQNKKSNESISSDIDKIKKDSIKTTVGKELSRERINTVFTSINNNNLGIKYYITKAYTFHDKLGKQYAVFTENIIDKRDDYKVIDTIKAFFILKKDDKLKILQTINDYIDKEYEKSMWFWTRYLSLKDFDNDGFIDPIIVYGSTSYYDDSKFDEGRVKIIIYYNGVKVVLRHQNSELDDGRHTQIDSAFYTLPNSIKKEVLTKINLMEERGHALYNTNIKNKIYKSISEH